MSQFRLPDLGEGLEEAQLVQWLVREGETVALNQPLCQVETAKALVDIPSPYAGTVERLHAAPGDTVAVGAPLITIAEASLPNPSPMGRGASEATDDGGHGPVLVGYGTEGPAQALTRRRRIPGGAASASPGAPSPSTTEAITGRPPVADAPVSASPLVRKMAEERGIDLRAIKGTGPGGRIRVEDLEAAPLPNPSPTGRRASDSPSPAHGGGSWGVGAAPKDEPGDERISTVGLRKAIAARMVRAATTIPHFTEYGLFDAAALVALRTRLKDDPRFASQHLTYLPFFVRALVLAVGEHRIMNSRWDDEGNAIVVRRAVHVGIATDTERGLLVPVIRDAAARDLAGIAAEAERLVTMARGGKAEPGSMMGGTITITNHSGGTVHLVADVTGYLR